MASGIYLPSVLAQNNNINEQWEVDENLINDNPVIKKWIEEIPDVSKEIDHRAIFTTKLKLNYVQFPSRNHLGGISFNVEDVFLGDTSLTLNGDYVTTFNDGKNDRSFMTVGGNLQYYLLPLGKYFNVAPLLGYKYVQSDNYSTEGVNIGFKVRLAFSSAGDITFTQSFLSPFNSTEIGLRELKTGYAVTENLGLSTGITWYNSPQQIDSQVNFGLQWIF